MPGASTTDKKLLVSLPPLDKTENIFTVRRRQIGETSQAVPLLLILIKT